MKRTDNMPCVFRDRQDAGRQLGAAMPDQYREREDVIVLGLPRGGVPVALQVANILSAPLDILVVRKLGLPEQPEFAMGAIAPGGIMILDEGLTQALGVSRQAIDAVHVAEQMELDRRLRRYRAGRPPLVVEGMTVVLVDDGLATGSTMKAAVAAVRSLGAHTVVVAVPVSSVQACEALTERADEVVCLSTPNAFEAVGRWYVSFPQTSDEEVSQILTSFP